MKIKTYFLYLAVLLCAISRAFGAGEVDTTFNASAMSSFSTNINVIKSQPDGKILFGGFFVSVNGKARYGLARINADGSIDNSFNGPDFIHHTGDGGVIYSIALQPDGKILVGGVYYRIGNEVRSGIVRLNPDGSIDNTFISISSFFGVLEIEILPDGKILAGGIHPSGLVRLNSDGSLDPAFQALGTAVTKIEVQADGKVLAVTGFGNGTGSLKRINSDGTIDTTFSTVTADQDIYDLKMLSNGSIMICGSFAALNGFSQGKISRINNDGSIDFSFNQSGSGAAGTLHNIIERPNGKMILSGIFPTYNSIARRNIAQINPDGSLDASFQFPNTFTDTFYESHLLSDGTIVVGTVSPTQAPVLFKLNPDGSRDNTFNTAVSLTGLVKEIIQQNDGKILICGRFESLGTIPRNSLARINTDGSADNTFLPYFNSGGKQTINSIALQPDGKILAGGANPSLKRLNPDGTEDIAFSNNLLLTGGIIEEIAVLQNGKILISGDLSFGGGIGIRRFSRINADGTYDTSFDLTTSAGPNPTVYKMLVQPDGKVLIGGEFTLISGISRGRIARLNSDGSVDTSFNAPGGANDTIRDIDLQPDGKVILAGAFTGLNGSITRKGIGRLNADGSLDTSFAQTVDTTVYGVKVQSDGKVLIAGSMTTVGTISKSRIARLNTDGSLDNSFTADASWIVWDVGIQGDGKILVGGEFAKINGVSAVRIARLNASSPAAPQAKRFDFDGDGKADIAVYRSSNNTWYIFKSGSGQLEFHNFGLGGDILTPADFDGDQKFDLSIFRPSTGFTWFREVTTGNYNGTQFGASGDIPVHSDYTGDGKADYVVFRPSNGVWYRYDRINNQTSIIQFGSNGDIPVIADFDGDGKSDLAVFRPSLGNWYWMNSSNGQFFGYHFGATGDLTVPADYDGDGKTDLAVYRPSDGGWYRILSGNGQFASTQFGISTDKPIPADYDGDGKADIGVFRASQSLWIILNSQSGSITGFQFGVPTDDPIPNAYVR